MSANLDDLNKIFDIDSENMFKVIYQWPELIEELMKKSSTIPDQILLGNKLISYKKNFSNVLICGMGGSAISGDYASELLKNEIKIPIIVQRSYNIPFYATEGSLIILISYSGNTEETLYCLKESIEKSVPIIGIGSGGKLKEVFLKYKLPFFPVLSNLHPRCSFPLIFFQLLRILQILSLIEIHQKDFKEMLTILRDFRTQFMPENNYVSNKAKQIAQELHKHIPIIWSPFLCVAKRMKSQLNENSKIIAIAEEFPELNHNHIMGFESYNKENPFIIVVFRFFTQYPNIDIRFKFTQELIAEKIRFIIIESKGNSLLSQLLYISYIGDYISIYLAILNNQDPNTTNSINYLKKQVELRTKSNSRIKNELEEFFLIK